MKKIWAAPLIALFLLLSATTLLPETRWAQIWEKARSTWNYHALPLYFAAYTPPVRAAATTEKIVALTFDDGPDPRYTLSILRILDEYHVPATFFVIGQSVREYPELTRLIFERGHALANHTFTHPGVETLTLPEYNQQLSRTNQLLQQISGLQAVYYRPPRGIVTAEGMEAARQQGLQTVLWTVCLENRNCPTPADMVRRAVARTGPGAIILVHDGRLDRRKSVEALPMLLQTLQQKGYSFVTLDYLLQQQPENM
ncbi:MAG: polysaccharide deacetylase family protein [Desulfurispora sp.]|uniref:polysaccharide deacetylase family protein n=1 Tax=Desulfurispora sp. TaxID=3014275 RepID=UPI0040491E40